MTEQQQATCVHEALSQVFIPRIGLALVMSAYAAMPINAQQKAGVLEHGNGVVAEWDFSPVDQGVALEKISGSHDPIAGISSFALKKPYHARKPASFRRSAFLEFSVNANRDESLAEIR